MRTNRTPVALVSMLAAAALLAACEKKTTTVSDTPGSTTSTTTSTTVTPSPAASDAMATTKSTMENAASATERGMAKAGDKLDDAAITGKVKTALIADPDVKALKIDVDTKDNVVTLTGKVHSAAEKNEAVRLAKTTTGVKRVVDHLTIEPKH